MVVAAHWALTKTWSSLLAHIDLIFTLGCRDDGSNDSSVSCFIPLVQYADAAMIPTETLHQALVPSAKQHFIEASAG